MLRGNDFYGQKIVRGSVRENSKNNIFDITIICSIFVKKKVFKR
jgi:hypothetical protein